MMFPITRVASDLAASLGDDWELIQKNVMGEWSTYLA